MDLTPELTELEEIALLGGGGEVAIPEHQMSQAELYEEIRLRLRGGGNPDILKVPKDDLNRVCDNLLGILDEAEARVGRPRVANAYYEKRGGSNATVGSKYSGAADIYRQARDRYTRSKLRPLEPRIQLVEAASSALGDAGEVVEEILGCVRLFKGTRVFRQIEDARNPRGLSDAGAALSNAWWTICDALEAELSLSRWFQYARTEVGREQVPLDQFLGCDRAFDFSVVRATDDLISSGKWQQGIPADAWLDTTFAPVLTQGYDALNLIQHVHDLSFAPAVSLFRQRYWSGHGRMWTPGENETRRRRFMVIWREVQLALLPDTDDEVAPYLINRRRVTVYGDGATGREIAMEYPFTRVFVDPGIIPLALGTDRLAVFEPSDLSPPQDMIVGATEAGEILVAPACTSQYANVWGARPDVIPLFLRHIQDGTMRPVDPAIQSAAEMNPAHQPLFAQGTVGEIIERATLVPDRAGGIGGLLRRDFLGKVEALRRKSGKEFLSPAPFAFEQAWM